MTRTSRRTRLATAAVLAPLAFGLVACGDDDSDDTTTTSSSSSSTEGGTTATLEGDVETAAQTALAEVDGTVFSVDGDPQGWDVTIVTSDGVENDLELAPDAASVTRGPDADTNEDADDTAEIERLLGVAVDYAAAMEAALGEVDGTVTGVELSEDGGTAVWEVQLDEDTPDEVTVEIDAESGDVLRTEQGD
ncbi:putative membrane protein YkoI [Nocardioides cavernae]|uniref:Putative membrane protein YkoI n=1 Tax=Nocardioides cavernae TaxID=1921566 RepID=A0A7Y9KQJ3_9ACTN|nr:PepSY domain-containing protein [Nocardioides cavernae]NYE35624.1 putative membrane protein YkoI [Nocardioides cavernae]